MQLEFRSTLENTSISFSYLFNANKYMPPSVAARVMSYLRFVTVSSMMTAPNPFELESSLHWMSSIKIRTMFYRSFINFLIVAKLSYY